MSSSSTARSRRASWPALDPLRAIGDRTPEGGPAITWQVLSGPGCLPGLRHRWNDLFRHVGTEPSTSYEWTASFIAHHAREGDQVRIIVLRRGDAVVGIVPLVARTPSGRAFCHVTPLAEHHQTRSDWLVAESTAALADAFVGALAALGLEWDRFRMARLLDDHSFGALVVEAMQRRGLRYFLRPQSPSYYLSLPPTFAGYLANRSSRFRNHLRRVEKKVGAIPTAVITLHDPVTAGELDAAYEMVLDIERSSWKQAHGTSIATEPSQRAFFRDLCRGALAEGRLHLQVMTVDGQPVAYNLGYLCHGRYSYLKTSFSDAHRTIGPATFLRARLIEDLIARGVTAIDFPGPPYEWEQQWTDELRWHSMLTVYSGSFRSRVLELLERVRHGADERTLSFVNPRAYPPPRPLAQ